MNVIGIRTCRGAAEGRFRVLHVGALALLLAAGAVPAPARAEFEPPVNVSKAGENAQQPQVTVDADGNAVIVWVNYDNGRVQGRGRAAAGTFGPYEIISSAGQLPQIGADPAGNSVIAWLAIDGSWRVQARGRSEAGVRSPVRTFSAAGQDAAEPRVAVDSDGNAVIVWRRWDGAAHRIQARTRSNAGARGPIKNVSKAGQSAEAPRVAFDTGGNAVIVWYLFDGTSYRVQARTLSAAGVFGPVKTISPAGLNAVNPQVAIDAAGTALIVWQRIGVAYWRIQARTLSAAGTLGQTRTLSRDGGSASEPQVAVDAGGNAVIAWLRSDGTKDRVQVRGRSAAGVLSAIRTLSAAGQHATEPRVAVDAGGDAVVIWQRSDGAAVRIQARTRTAAGALGPVQTLSDAGQSATFAQVAVNASGKAVAVWVRFDGTFLRIQTAAGP